MATTKLPIVMGSEKAAASGVATLDSNSRLVQMPTADEVGVSNRNLLDNPWFTVNSRGQTTYSTDSAYTVDRWKIGSSGTLTVGSGYVVFNAGDSALRNLEQVVASVPVGTYTLSVDAENSSGANFIFGINSNYYTVSSSSDFRQIFSRTFTVTAQDVGGVYLQCPNKDVKIYSVKLELGSVSTLALDSPPDYATEFFKCCNSTADSSDTYANKHYNPTASNKNLLDNWYWGTGVVNQRGATTYTSGYTVDRWKIFGSATVQITDSGLKITTQAGTQGIQHIIPAGIITAGNTYTISINTDQGILSYTFTAENSDTWTYRYSFAYSSFSIDFWTAFQVGGTFQILIVASTAQDSMLLKSVKLELGSVSTLAYDAPPDYAEELAKCQRYCYGVTGLSASQPVAYTVSVGSKYVHFPIHLPQCLYKAPSITMENMQIINDYNGADVYTYSAYSVYRATPESNYVELQITADTVPTSGQHLYLCGTGSGSLILSADL